MKSCGHFEEPSACALCAQWKQHLAELEAEMKVEPSIKYVLYEVLFSPLSGKQNPCKQLAISGYVLIQLIFGDLMAMTG